jgi:hypothetical protein
MKFSGNVSPFVSISTFVSCLDGKFYVSLVAKPDDSDTLNVGITGPYNTEHEAHHWADEWEGRAEQCALRGEIVTIPDEASIPEDVRAQLTTEVTDIIREQGFDLAGQEFGGKPH